MPSLRCLRVCLAWLPAALAAAPAAWYKWQSKATGHIACAQASPGEGWERGLMAFRDSRCTQPR
jgi:hypothetical protein